MLGYSQILSQQLPPGSLERDRAFHISHAAELATGLTQQLLAFSRKQMLDVRVMDLNNLVSDTETMLRRLIGEDIDLATDLDTSIGKVRADPVQMQQIIMNLAVNARHAMPTGGKLVIETGAADLDEEYVRKHGDVEPGPYVMFAVSDSGMGMDPEILSHILDPFFTTKEKGRGTLLGLATVYGIVKQHRGHIAVYSEVGKGTTFKGVSPT